MGVFRDFVAWKWTPFFALSGGSLLFVVLTEVTVAAALSPPDPKSALEEGEVVDVIEPATNAATLTGAVARRPSKLAPGARPHLKGTTPPPPAAAPPPPPEPPPTPATPLEIARHTAPLFTAPIVQPPPPVVEPPPPPPEPPPAEEPVQEEVEEAPAEEAAEEEAAEEEAEQPAEEEAPPGPPGVVRSLPGNDPAEPAPDPGNEQPN